MNFLSNINIMNFPLWKQWVNNLPWSRKWFVFLILMRPIIDNFYYLKEKSPFYSPLYIVGVLTPVFIIFTFVFNKPRHLTFTRTDFLFFTWSFFLCFNCSFLLFNYPSLEMLGHVLKILTPMYLFLYLRYFIRSKNDLVKILQTGVYAAIIPAGILLYEVFFSPIKVGYSRGIKRIWGGYGDVTNYAVYSLLTLLIIGYFLLLPKRKIFYSKEILKVILIVVLCFLTLLMVAHASSYAVLIALGCLFFWYNMKLKRKRGLIILLVIVIFSSGFFKDIYKERISPLLSREMIIIKGEGEIESIAHGRGRRWFPRVERFFSLPMTGYFIGAPVANIEGSSILWTGNPHNDYLRILFLTGLFGLFSYLLILRRIFLSSTQLPIPERFLVFGSLLVVLFYSVATNTMLYNSLLYILLTIFAYSCLPRLNKVDEKYSKPIYKLFCPLNRVSSGKISLSATYKKPSSISFE